MSIPMSRSRQSLHNTADQEGWKVVVHNIHGDVFTRPNERITVDYALDGRIQAAWVSLAEHLNADGRFDDCIDAQGKAKDRQVIDWMKRLDWSGLLV